MKQILVLILLLQSFITSAKSKDEVAIRKMLAAQVVEWNKGMIAGYMKGYWENDSLVFIGKNGPTYGFRQTLERYQKSYPDLASMGQLTSTILSIKKLSSEYFFVVGKWELERTAGNLKGSYSLLLRKINGEWVIVNDHSS
ncbi:MAG TPA: nuclear transport factor 2 family protein [Flavipsychrobacter sp.]|nr:nuclear transport factor 2 family protein [Flavipsychrobacter sp.]